MAQNILGRASFAKAKAIGPAIQGDWPGKRTTSLYWRARKNIYLPCPADFAKFMISADRHYELYINGQLAVRQRGFFSGDEYLFAQRWSESILPLLQSGENTIDVVIRSDSWRNKNYRCFQPMLMLEASFACGEETIRFATDESWQVAIIDGWREHIALGANGTIHFEKVRISPKDAAILSGFANELNFSAPRVLDRDALPIVYMWNDPPKRIDVNLPKQIVATGTYNLADKALVFDVAPAADAKPNDGPVVLEKSFENAGNRELAIASSSLIPHRIELNGDFLYENKNIPNKQQMPLAEYLVPTVRTFTMEGLNHLRLIVSEGPRGWLPLRLSVKGLPVLMEPHNWTNRDGRPVNAIVEPLELSEQIGAKFDEITNDSIKVTQEPFSIELQEKNKRSFALLDFGKVVSGRIKLKISSASAGRINLAYGFGHILSAVDCHKMHMRAVDVLEVQAGESVYEAFDVRTFRYLDMLFEEFSGSVTVSDIQAEEPVFLDEGESAFETSDPKVTAIWRASRRTAQLCGDELYVDNPEREHAQWSDGIMAGASAGYYVFSEQRKVAKVLEEFMLAQQVDGQLPGYTPGKWFPRLPLQCHMALFCLLSHRHFMHTGDEALADRTFEAILKIIAHWQRHTNRHGLISNLHTVFVDWGSHIYSYGRGCKGSTGALTTMNAYYLGSLKAAAKMAEFLGRDKEALRLWDTADSVQCTITQQMYDSSCGLFRDGVGEALAESNVSQTANALAVLFGAAPDGQEKEIMTRAFGLDRPANIIPANAFFSDQSASAMFESGCDKLALNWLRDGFGRMLDIGPGTLWETWQPYASLCQATGAAPIYLFARYLTGIYPAKPGYAEIGIDPHPADLDHLNATIRTPMGQIKAQWRRTGEKLKYRLHLPNQLQNRPIVKPRWVEMETT